ncbi:MAG TPA: ArsR family transcriptional regulator [Phaeodactylibacter sp.]|nr:ArsR family transcriptional regulator [Phaeodactylibacter sp.]
MGLSKTEGFTKKQKRISLLAKAIGHPARVAIIDYLLKKNICICKDIVGELPLSQPTISQHLKELKSAGLIRGSVEGTSVCYCIDVKGFKDLMGYCIKVVQKLEDMDTCC